MSPSPDHLISFLSLIMLSVPTAGINTTPQTLAASNVYGQMEPCAQGCFYQWEGYCSYDLVAGVLGCAANCLTWASNDCYCRTDYQPIATSYLWTCVSKGCTRGDNNLDITSATNAYVTYCENLGYHAPAQAPITAQPPTVYVTITVTKSYAVRTLTRSLDFMVMGILVVQLPSLPLDGIIGVNSLADQCHYRPASSPATVNRSSTMSAVFPFTTTSDTVTTSSSIESISTSTSDNASPTVASNSGGSGGGTGNLGTILGSVFGGLAVVVALLAWLIPRKVIVELFRAVFSRVFPGSQTRETIQSI